MAKSAKYSSKEEMNGMESLSERLAQDLRRHIRQINNYPLLSEAWLEMADTFGRIATISDMESSLAGSKEGTIWETEEQALKFLLEDGKLNVCLRTLIEYKRSQAEERDKGEVGRIFEMKAECDKFEKGIGIVLRNAWNHVEALQTTDLSTLSFHISSVLDGGIRFPSAMISYLRNGDFHQRQEVLIFYYLASLLRFVDDILESRIMPYLRDRNVFMKAAQMLNLYHKEMFSLHVLKGVEALSLMVETDDFKTNKDLYISGKSDAEALINFKLTCLTPLLSNFDNRKLMRPLIEVIDKSKRQYRL